MGVISNAGSWIKNTLGEGYDNLMNSKDTMLPEESSYSFDNKEVGFGNSSEGGGNSIDALDQNNIKSDEFKAAVTDGKHSLLDGALNNFNVPGGPSKYTGYNQVEKKMDEKFEEDWQDEMDRDEEMQHRAENIGRYGTDNLGDVAKLNLEKHNKAQNDKKQKTGAVLSAFSDAFGKMRSDLRDPYLYDSASIFGKGINS